MKHIGTALATILALGISATSFQSCERADYPERYRSTDGVPTVYYVRYSGSTAPDVHITSAYYDEVICFVGDNLRSVHDIYFNDVKATLNSSYITDHTLICNVTKTLPTVKTDKVYMVNYSNDTVAIDFKTLAPAPVVKSMSYEYAPAGTKVTLYGNYFIQDSEIPLSVSFAGADPVTKFDNIEMTEITFTMPKASEGTVSVTTASGTGTSAFHYLESRNILFDFDKLPQGNHGWHAQTITTDASAVTGNYLQLGNGTAELKADGTDWDDSNFHLEYWAGNWGNPETYSDPAGVPLSNLVSDDLANFADMSFKFDICVPSENPWTGCPMQIIFSDVALVSYGDAGVVDSRGITMAGCNNTYFHDEGISLPRGIYKPWEESGSFDTGGKWITASVPFSSFTKYWDESDATGNLTSAMFDNLEVFCAAGKAAGTKCTPIIRIDNIRLVPNK